MEWERESFDRGNGTCIPRNPISYAQARQPPPPCPAGEPSSQGAASPAIPPSSHPSSSRLIIFPDDDILGDLTSDQLNVLIFHYLEEKGFPQTAYQLANEAGIKNINDIDKSAIPKGTLFSFVRDGLKYTELKANLHANDSGSFIKCCCLDPLDVITINVESCLSQFIEDKEVNGLSLMDLTLSVPSLTRQVSDSDVFVSAGHSLESSSCAWSPTDSLLAVGAPNSTAQIWRISDDFSSMHSSIPRGHILFHSDAETYEIGSITEVAWNGEGELLATGSPYGRALIWNKNGELHKTLDEQDDESILSIVWNSKGDLLLVLRCDSTVKIWDTRTWKPKQELISRSELLPSVAWRNNTSFTTCTRDKRICVWNVGHSQPIITFTGHQEEIGGVKWDPTGTLLASNSDDGAIKIWTLQQDQSLHNLMHCEGQAINSIRWSPTGPGTSNPNKPLLLASASDDGTVRIWDGAQGQLLYSFDGHWEPVIEIEFSPDGEYIASESEEQRLLIWEVKDGTIVKCCSGCDPSQYELSWNREGNKIAAGYKNGALCVIRLW